MKVYRLKVTLKDNRPPIWRRIEVPSDIKLGKLHQLLQEAMGWTDSHLHAFNIGDESYGVPDPEWGGDTKSERNVRLDAVVGEGDTFVYEYDFGDGWQHTLKVEKVLSAQPGIRYPRCTGGKHACPPEDCGGPYGYAHLLEVLCNPDDEEHEEMLEWVPPDFDSEAFDLEEVNEALRQIK